MRQTLLERLAETGMKTGEPPSLHYGGSTSVMTARPQNILIWLYDNAPLRYMHKRFAMGISLRGGCVVGVDGAEHSLKPGDGIIIFPFQAHYIRPKEQGNMINLAVTFALRDTGDNSLAPLKDTVFSLTEKDMGIILEFVAAGRHGETGERSQEAAPLLEWFLSRKLTEKILRPETDSSLADDSSHYSKIVKYIRGHLSSSITAKDISEGTGLSVPHLRRVFKKRTSGMSIGRFILSLRIKQAYEMLMRADMSIAEIGEKCGFSDQFVFSRAFKRIAGLSPANYRKQRGGNP